MWAVCGESRLVTGPALPQTGRLPVTDYVSPVYRLELRVRGVDVVAMLLDGGVDTIVSTVTHISDSVSKAVS